MKKYMKQLGLAGGLAVLAIIGTGCSLFVRDKSPKEYQGVWVDVNGSTRLEFKGNKLKIDTGYSSETYKYTAVKSDYGTVTIDSEKKEGFGDMSAITVNQDGYLTAEEMILDADGHHYRFVREDQLEKEKQIRDLSEDLPKTISSHEIEEFSLTFTKDGLSSYGLDDSWPSGSYSWEIEEDDGSYSMDFRISGDSYIIMDFHETVSERYMKGLDELIRKLDLPSLNGYYKANNVHRAGYFLNVEYESDEVLRIMAKGDAAAECVFDLPALLDYAREAGVDPEEW